MPDRENGLCYNCGRAECPAPETPSNVSLWHLYPKAMQDNIRRWKAIHADCDAHTTDWMQRALEAEAILVQHAEETKKAEEFLEQWCRGPEATKRFQEQLLEIALKV